MLISPERHDQLKDLTDHHAPDSAELEAIARIRQGALTFLIVIDENCPESADKTLAMQEVRQSMMRANSSIVLKGRGLQPVRQPARPARV